MTYIVPKTFSTAKVPQFSGLVGRCCDKIKRISRKYSIPDLHRILKVKNEKDKARRKGWDRKENNKFQ